MKIYLKWDLQNVSHFFQGDILVQYDIGTTSDRKVILLLIKIEWVSDKIIKLFSDYM